VSVVSSPFRPVPIHPHPPLASRVARKKHASSSIPHRTNARVDAIHARDAMAAGRPRRSRLVDGRVPTVHGPRDRGRRVSIKSNRRVMTQSRVPSLRSRSRSRPVPSRRVIHSSRRGRRGCGRRGHGTRRRSRGDDTSRRGTSGRDSGVARRESSRARSFETRAVVRSRVRSFVRAFGRSVDVDVGGSISFIHSFIRGGWRRGRCARCARRRRGRR